MRAKLVPWILAGAPVHGSPNIVGGANCNCTVVSFHQHDYSDPGVFGSWLLPC